MRPQGPERMALATALAAGEGTSRDLAARARVGLDVARTVLDNMVRAEAAVKLAPVRVAGVKRPVPVYGPPAPQQPTDALAAAVGVWWLDALTGELS